MIAHLLENRLREQMRRENHLEIKQVDDDDGEEGGEKVSH